jgi:hypothetical protein
MAVMHLICLGSHLRDQHHGKVNFNLRRLHQPVLGSTFQGDMPNHTQVQGHCPVVRLVFGASGFRAASRALQLVAGREAVKATARLPPRVAGREAGKATARLPPRAMGQLLRLKPGVRSELMM